MHTFQRFDVTKNLEKKFGGELNSPVSGTVGSTVVSCRVAGPNHVLHREDRNVPSANHCALFSFF